VELFGEPLSGNASGKFDANLKGSKTTGEVHGTFQSSFQTTVRNPKDTSMPQVQASATSNVSGSFTGSVGSNKLGLGTEGNFQSDLQTSVQNQTGSFQHQTKFSVTAKDVKLQPKVGPFSPTFSLSGQYGAQGTVTQNGTQIDTVSVNQRQIDVQKTKETARKMGEKFNDAMQRSMEFDQTGNCTIQ
jgi:hypothetical protein